MTLLQEMEGKPHGRPTLLDLFCGATVGGCAAGYARAGFRVTGVDHLPQPRYLLSGASEFVEADALAYLAEHGREYDVISASPPCQHYSRATAWRGDRANHPDLIALTRSLLAAAGRPHVIENVPDAQRLLRFPLVLCGTMFGLRVRRHRYFECPSLPLVLVEDCRHRADDYSFDHGFKQTEATYRDAMGVPWMTVEESRQAVPPAFTQWLGTRLLTMLEERP